MPTIKTREFKHVAKSGEQMQFKAPITVDASGEFTINIPEELVGSAKAVARLDEWKRHVRVDQARVNWRVQGRILGEVERFIEEAMKDHLSVTVVRELVIRYRYENNTTWARSADGSIHPNGHFAAKDGEGDEQRSWEWAGNRSIDSNNRPTLFGVGVVAHVYMKVTYSRQSGSRTEYTHELPGSHWDKNPMRRLNSFLVGLPERDGMYVGGVLRSGHHTGAGVREMPYSDAAADFFSDLMLAMCRLGEQLDAYVGTKENLALAIERGVSQLGGKQEAAVSLTAPAATGA